MTQHRYPFGQPLTPVVQQDRTLKRVFILGVYASAVHARWLDAEGKILIQALAIASEPYIFWRGDDAEKIIQEITLPAGAGTLAPAAASFNGPSGIALDQRFIEPLGLSRNDAWLCDLVPHTCLNDGQRKALDRAYEPRREQLGLPPVTLPSVPSTFADEQRRQEVLDELLESEADLVILLGDQPIAHFIAPLTGQPARLANYGTDPDSYGRLHPVELGGRKRDILPLVHPRQAAGLGSHSSTWKELHDHWAANVADRLLA